MKKTKVLWRLVAVLILYPATFVYFGVLAQQKPGVTAGASCHVEQTNYMGLASAAGFQSMGKTNFCAAERWQADASHLRWPSVSVCESPLCRETLSPLQQRRVLTYGGDKLWVLPEGSQDEQHWAGNSDLLDDGPFEFQVLSQGQRCEISLTGASRPPDRVAVYEKRGSRRGLAAHQLSRSDKERERASDRMVRAIGLSVQYGRRKGFFAPQSEFLGVQQNEFIE